MAKTTKKSKKTKEMSDEKPDTIPTNDDVSLWVREEIVPISSYNTQEAHRMHDHERDYCTNEFGYIKVTPTEQTLMLFNHTEESNKETSMLVPIILFTMICIPLVIYFLYR